MLATKIHRWLLRALTCAALLVGADAQTLVWDPPSVTATTWEAPASYRVYVGTNNGPYFYRSTTNTFLSLAGFEPATYSFYATAVGSSGVESAPSQEVIWSASAPAPPPPPCSFSLSSSSASFSSFGGAGSVSVMASATNCSWAVSGAPGWITVTTGALGGTGSGKVSYSVARNYGGARSATMTVAGKGFTVYQNRKGK